MTTAVEPKEWCGKPYLGAIRPVHPPVVDSTLKRTAGSKPTPR
nr:DUF2867 domain-containing protein [Arthrobacter sp. StoSoilB20]